MTFSDSLPQGFPYTHLDWPALRWCKNSTLHFNEVCIGITLYTRWKKNKKMYACIVCCVCIIRWNRSHYVWMSSPSAFITWWIFRQLIYIEWMNYTLWQCKNYKMFEWGFFKFSRKTMSKSGLCLLNQTIYLLNHIM